jgi:hypothetical protein
MNTLQKTRGESFISRGTKYIVPTIFWLRPSSISGLGIAISLRNACI